MLVLFGGDMRENVSCQSNNVLWNDMRVSLHLPTCKKYVYHVTLIMIQVKIKSDVLNCCQMKENETGTIVHN